MFLFFSPLAFRCRRMFRFLPSASRSYIFSCFYHSLFTFYPVSLWLFILRVMSFISFFLRPFFLSFSFRICLLFTTTFLSAFFLPYSISSLFFFLFLHLFYLYFFLASIPSFFLFTFVIVFYPFVYPWPLLIFFPYLYNHVLVFSLRTGDIVDIRRLLQSPSLVDRYLFVPTPSAASLITFS